LGGGVRVLLGLNRESPQLTSFCSSWLGIGFDEIMNSVQLAECGGYRG
jgi:hypothetical protein